MSTRRENERSVSNQYLGNKDTGNQVVRKTTAGYYSNIEPGISMRPPYDKTVRDYYRDNDAVPKGETQESLKKIQKICTQVYERIGIIKSVVDLMSEFASEGIEIVHPDAGPQKFYKEWSKRVNLPDRAERFANWLCKAGATVVRRKNGTLKYSGFSASIPLEYVFYDPSTVEILEGEATLFSDYKSYGIRVPYNTIGKFKNTKNKELKKIYDGLPAEIKKAVDNGQKGYLLTPIDNNDIYVAHYKKDDSVLWSKSFIYSVLEDVFYNDKLRLAKMSALDGWYNVLRLWKLGNVEKEIYPSPEMFQKLSTMLEQNTGGGSMDLLWRDDIEVQELYPPVEKLLNFDENIDNILVGLGVPQGFIGGKAKGSDGMTTNFLGLKNFIKRLEAIRRAIIAWLNTEIDIIQKEMGFKVRPSVRFYNTDLHDERTYYKLLLDMVDRNIISDETLIERIREFPEIERSRVQRETEMRDNGVLPEKTSPFHQQNTSGDPDANNDNGRPPGSKDTVKRSRRPNRIKKTKAEFLLEGFRVFDLVNTYINEQAIERFGVANLRQLTSEQENLVEKAKLQMFVKVEPFTISNKEDLDQFIDNQDAPIGEFWQEYNSGISSLHASGKDNLKNDDKRIMAVNAYIAAWSVY